MDRIHRMTRGRKTLLTLLLVGAVATVAGIGTFSAFSATTENDGNVFNAGTVSIADNDLGAAMYNVTNAKPGTSVQACIQVTYTGSLPADVSLYADPATPIGPIGGYVNLTIEKGTGMGPFPNCAGFSAQGGPLYNGTLGGFATASTNFGSGASTYPGAQTQWNQNDALVYRFTLTLQNNNAAVGLQSVAHNFIWEARNQ